MIRNRWFKQTLGVPSEVIIAKDLDDSTSPSAGTAPTGTVNVTIAGTPTLNDTLVINVDGYIYTYTVGAGETTAALAATAIEAMLDANSQGFTASHTGTTSAVFTLTGPNGTSFNGKTVTGSEGGSTFSAITTANFSGGVNPVVGFKPTHADFVDDAAAGDLAAYWEDDGTAVTYGSTSNPANSKRKYFYAWKQADGTSKVSTSLEAGRISNKTSIPYFAGQSDVWTVTLGGTISIGQTVILRIIDTTSTIIPYPNWSFEVISTGVLNTDATNLRAQINAETIDKVFVASGSGANVVITFTDTSRTFKVLIAVETTFNEPVNEEVNVIVHTTPAKAPIGTYADIKELEKYFLVQQGSPLYTGQGNVNLEELGLPASNVDAAITYGIFILKSWRFEKGEVKNFEQPLYVIIALPTADLATIAGL
jgi:hypothetical protein